MLVSPQNSYATIFISNMKALEGGAFGRYLGHEGAALINGISAFISKTPQSSLAALPCAETTTSLRTGRGPSFNHPGSLTSDFQALETVRNKFLFFIGWQICGISL